MEALIPIILTIVVALLIGAVLSFIVDRVPFIDGGLKELVKFGILAVLAIYVLLKLLAIMP